jgi:Uma2 family endonuclease
MTATQTKLLTVVDLEAMGSAAEHLELIRGVAYEMSPTGGQHGLITSLLTRRLGAFVEEHGLGETYTAEGGFIVARSPDSVLAPDVAFVANERLPRDGCDMIGFTPFAPDLAIEVASPSNTEASLLLKTSLYLAGGTKQVWIVRPRQQTVTVFSPDEPERILGLDDALDGGNVVPGFSLPVTQLFRRSAAGG